MYCMIQNKRSGYIIATLPRVFLAGRINGQHNLF